MENMWRDFGGRFAAVLLVQLGVAFCAVQANAQVAVETAPRPVIVVQPPSQGVVPAPVDPSPAATTDATVEQVVAPPTVVVHTGVANQLAAPANTVPAAPPSMVAPMTPAQARAVRGPRSYERGAGEIVELYVSLGVLGGFTGVGLPFMAGLRGDERDPGVQLGYSFGSILGIGAGVGVAALLDNPTLRTGIGPSISTGARWGILMGLLTMGTYSNNGFDDRQNVALVMSFGLGGALLGAGLGFGLRPHTSEVRFTETAGLWGLGLGGLISGIYSGAESRSGRGSDGAVTAFITELGALMGLATGFALSAGGLNVSTKRAWFMTLGFGAGIAAGSLIALLAASASRGNVQGEVLGTLGATGAIAGLVLTYLFTQGDENEERFPQEEPPVSFGISPTQSGGMATLWGSF